jgi:hypothetical protein
MVTTKYSKDTKGPDSEGGGTTDFADDRGSFGEKGEGGRNAEEPRIPRMGTDWICDNLCNPWLKDWAVRWEG